MITAQTNAMIKLKTGPAATTAILAHTDFELNDPGITSSAVSSPSIMQAPPRGSSLNVYSVSPRRTPKSFGPMPTANSSTTIPFFFATIKCPNSWNMTMMPNTRSATISFNLPPAFYITIGPLFSLKYIFKRRMINPLMGCHTL